MTATHETNGKASASPGHELIASARRFRARLAAAARAAADAARREVVAGRLEAQTILAEATLEIEDACRQQRALLSLAKALKAEAQADSRNTGKPETRAARPTPIGAHPYRGGEEPEPGEAWPDGWRPHLGRLTPEEAQIIGNFVAAGEMGLNGVTKLPE